jgi:rhodanese-related sulfurtransferase
MKTVTAQELNTLISSNFDIKIIDVRSMEEFATGSIEGAILLQLHLIPIKIRELKPNDKLIMICRSGARSGQATLFLEQNGFPNVYNLTGGVVGWVNEGYKLK